MNTTDKKSDELKDPIDSKPIVDKPIDAQVSKKIKEAQTKNWLYVSPADKKWTVRKDGSGRALHIYKLKSAALNAAKKIADPLSDKHIIVFNTKGEISKIIQ